MLFNTNHQEDDPFTQLINQSSANAQNQQAQQQEKPHQFLQNVVSNEPKGKEDWVSPFRQRALSGNQNNRLYVHDAKNRKFPTVSATSTYSKKQPQDLGYKNIPNDVKRAKDIKFPTYLTKNEERQYQLLTELELKEKHLKYLKKCQKITDLTGDGNNDTSSTTSSSSSLSSSEDEDTASAIVPADNETTTTATTTTTAASADSADEATSIEEEQNENASEVTPTEKTTTDNEKEIPEPETVKGEQNLAEPAVAEPAVAEPAVTEPAVTEPAVTEPAVTEPAVTETTAAIAQSDVPELAVTAESDNAPESAAVAASDDVSEVAVAPIEEPKVETSVVKRDIVTEEGKGELADAEAETEQSSEDEHGGETSTPETSEAESDGDNTPIDPSKAPKVPFQDRPQKERTGFFALWKSPTSSSAKKGTATAPLNPVATPENPELIVKTKEHGYLSKAVYDKINYDEKVHQAWLVDLRAKEKAKYDAKNNEYKEKLQDLQNKIDEIENSMKQLREETSKKIEVNKNRLVKQIIDINTEHNNKKLMIFKDTENMKTQKIEEKNEVLSRQTNVKSEIDELNSEKINVQKEFNDWTTNLSNLSQQLDAQIFKINQINLKQSKAQNETDNLEKEKNDLITQTEENKKLHEKNQEVLESVENKEYLPQINDIDAQISTLLNQMTIIRQENANERTHLSAITKKLEDERRAHEEQLKLEAEERKRKEENLLEKQRQELEEQAHQAQLEHEEQITQVKKTYNDQLTELQDKLAAEEEELEAVKRERTRLQGEKAIEEQTRQKNADDALKQTILDKQHKQAEGLHAAENHVKTPSNHLQESKHAIPKNDSMYEYHTEEDVMYA